MLRAVPHKLHHVTPHRGDGGTGPSRTPSFPYRRGEVFDALVLRLCGKGRVLLSTPRGRFEAVAHRKVVEKAVYRFRALRTAPGVRLEVVGGPARMHPPHPAALVPGGSHRFLQALSNLFGQIHGGAPPRGVLTALADLKALFPLLARSSPSGNPAGMRGLQIVWGGSLCQSEFLQNLFGKDRRFFKSLSCRDVERSLRGLLKALEKERGPWAAKARAWTSEAMAILRSEEEAAAASATARQGWCWLMGPHEEKGFQGAEGYIRKTETDDACILLLYTRWSRLGSLEAWLFLKGRMISVHLRSPDEGTVLLVEKHAHLLEEGLRQAGFVVKAIGYEVKKEGAGDPEEEVPSAAGEAWLDLVI